MDSMEDRSEIVFFDLETTIPTRPGQVHAILEFGAILVCPKKLVELDNYSSLVRPADLSLISTLSVRCNGITRDAVVAAPTFLEISDKVYNVLHGRIWAGHNILRFDCARIREAFAEIGKPMPEPRGTIDSLALLTQRFGRRAGDMKMASLANYFGLGQQSHRSLDDVRMNLEVVKYCATVLFLESSLPDIFSTNSWVSPNASTRSRSNGKASPNGTSLNTNPSSLSLRLENESPTNQRIGEGEAHPMLSSTIRSRPEVVLGEYNATQPDPLDMSQMCNEMNTEFLQPDVTMEEKPVVESPEMSSTVKVSEGCSGSAGFIEPDEVSIPSISASLVPFYRGSHKIKILHKDVALQLCCPQLRVRFGINTKFVDHAGRPRLSFVVDASPSLCRVLDACDNLAKRLSVESGSSSEWRPVVGRKNFYFNSSTVRLNIPTVAYGEVAIYATEIYQKESSSAVQKLVFSRIDAAELDTLFVPGTLVDASFSLDLYDYQQSAGIRLVANKLTIHST